MRVGAILCQEHHAASAGYVDLQHRARASGWNLQGAEGVRRESGRGTAGVGIATSSSVGACCPLGGVVDCSPPKSEGRLAAMWIDGVLRGGVLLLSIYFWHSEGLTERNKTLLAAAGEVIARAGGPWVIGGDFNMSPAEFSEAAGEWLDRVGGQLFAPDAPTCTTGVEGRTIDYFVVDRRVSGAVHSIVIDEESAASPHSPVILRLRGDATRDLARQLRKPKAFPGRRPIGCCRNPALPDPAILDLVGGGGGSVQAAVDLDHAFEHVMALAETELCGLCDDVDAKGHPDGRYTGRGLAPRVVWRPVVPPSARDCGRGDRISLGLLWLANRLRELASLLAAAGRRNEVSEGMMKQWLNITARLRRPRGTLQRMLRDCTGDWQLRATCAGHLTPDNTFAANELRKWAAEALDAARVRGIAAASSASKGWHAWIDEQLRGGAGALHRLAKRSAIVADQATVTDFGPTASLQATLDSDREAWRAVWEKFATTARAPWRELRGDWADKLAWASPLPPIEKGMITATAKTYRERTGLGVESFHPRWFGWLSDALLDALAALLMALEAKGYWPEQVRTILVAQIPKASGGRRPIGLLPGLVRIWERLRKPVVEVWRRSVERDYNWAAKGRSAQTAVWRQALRDEAAIARGKMTAATLVDLVKAFEMVKLELVWRQGLALHFPPLVLRMVLESFAFARMLSWKGAVAEEVHTLSAILAGGSFATDALYIVLIWPCDELVFENPRADLCLFVDDLTLHVEGDKEEQVANDLQSLVRSCFDKLEGSLELTVSRSAEPWKTDPAAKTIALASCPAVAKLIEPKLRALGVATHSRGKLLGVDYACGSKLLRRVQKGRLKQAEARARRGRGLGTAAATRLTRTGLMPALRYGVGVCGAAESTVRAARKLACSAMGEMRGRSTFARLKLAALDIGAYLTVDPIVEWAKAAWDKVVSRAELTAAWRLACSEVGLAERPFHAVRGPAGATMASATRLGWKMPSPFSFIDDSGAIIMLDAICPKDLERHARRALEDRDAAASSLAARIGGVPDLEALRDTIVSKAISGTAVAGSLRALGEGGWWTQERLFLQGTTGITDPHCRACLPAAGSDATPAVGTLWHRCCQCPAMDDIRQRHRNQDIIKKARSDEGKLDSLFVHGVPKAMPRGPTPRAAPRVCVGTVSPENVTLSGNVFTDGAMRGKAPASARRSGWAAVQVDSEAAVVQGLFGPCPDLHPTAFRAELWAAVQALQHARVPVKLHVDNQGVVDGWRRGRGWCTAAARPAADLWKLFWSAADNIGADGGIDVVKVKGHATDADVQAGRSTAYLRLGNAHADHFAGKGVDEAIGQAPNEAAILRYKMARNWYTWLSTVVGNWPSDMQPRVRTITLEGPCKKSAVGGGRNEPPYKLHTSQPHSLVVQGTRLVCSVCVRSSALSSLRCARSAFATSACTGAPPQAAVGPGHQIYRTEGLIWCNACGAYGEKRRGKLQSACPGFPGQGAKTILRRLRANLHPATAAPMSASVRVLG